jgi:hypothetical protein
MVGTDRVDLRLGRRLLVGLVLLLGTVAHAAERAGQIDCVQLAAQRYGVPDALIRAILKVEGGKVGQAVRNSNGTEDLGPMQINTIWLPRLAEYGITREQLQHDRCINILAGAWILSRQLQAADRMEGPLQRRLWWGIGAYHSRTPKHNVKYALRVWQAMRQPPES